MSDITELVPCNCGEKTKMGFHTNMGSKPLVFAICPKCGLSTGRKFKQGSVARDWNTMQRALKARWHRFDKKQPHESGMYWLWGQFDFLESEQPDSVDIMFLETPYLCRLDATDYVYVLEVMPIYKRHDWAECEDLYWMYAGEIPQPPKGKTNEQR